LKCQLRDFGSTQAPLISLPDQKLRWKQNGKTVTGRSKNLDEIFSIKREKNIRPSQSSDQNWSILAGLTGNTKARSIETTSSTREMRERKPTHVAVDSKGNLERFFSTSLRTHGLAVSFQSLFCGYIKNGP
jgi:hypothetical protein